VGSTSIGASLGMHDIGMSADAPADEADSRSISMIT
jgi:hypothetical protein